MRVIHVISPPPCLLLIIVAVLFIFRAVLWGLFGDIILSLDYECTSMYLDYAYMRLTFAVIYAFSVYFTLPLFKKTRRYKHSVPPQETCHWTIELEISPMAGHFSRVEGSPILLSTSSISFAKMGLMGLSRVQRISIMLGLSAAFFVIELTVGKFVRIS